MKNIKIVLTVLIMTTGLTSCKKYLEQLPDQRTELNSPEKVAELLVTAYPQANYIPFTEAMSDNAADKGTVSQSESVNSDPWYFRDVRYNDRDSPAFYWRACYAAIAAANHALEAIDHADKPDEYRASKGEALVARAYAHFMLVTLFSKVYDPATAASDPGIPYVTKPENVVIAKYERKTVAYVYEQIEKDLTEGLPLINNTSYKVQKYHFTTYAAHAFAARFYLFKRDYPKVIEHANQVFLGTNPAGMLRQLNSQEYRNLSGSFNELEARYTKATESSNLLLTEMPSIWGRSYPTYRFGLTQQLYPSILNSNVSGQQLTYTSYLYTRGDPSNIFIPKFREHFVRDGINSNIGFPHNMVPLFSTEEVLLNRAEAFAASGNYSSAIDDINIFLSTRIVGYIPSDNIDLNTIYSYYNTVDPKEGIVRTVLDLKRAEFLFEGQRWFDILRHKLTVIHRPVGGEEIVIGPNDPRRVLQLPAEAESAGLELNPR